MKMFEKLREVRLPLLVFLAALAIFCLFSWKMLLRQSQAPQFIYQADAILHGRLHLEGEPPNMNDWAKFEGKFYNSFPPLPSVLMLPLVAAAGKRFNDVAFTIPFAALNASLMFLALGMLSRRGSGGRSERENLWLTALFAVGTVNFFCSIRGEVWYTAHVIGLTLLLLYILASDEAKHPFWAGACLGLAVISRTPMLFAFPYFLFHLHKTEGLFNARAAKKLVWFCAPLAAVGVATMLFNYARFGNPLEFGHSYLFNNRVTPDIEKFGLFNYHFLERNLHAMLTRLPVIKSAKPLVTFDGNGIALWITTPAFLLLLWPQRRTWLHGALWATVGLTALPSLFYMNTGYYQFGYRFSLDYTPFLVMLLAAGGRGMGWPFKLLILAGIGVNTWGAVVFGR